MAIARSKIVDLVIDVLCESDALTSEEVEDLAVAVADKMVMALQDVYDDSRDDKIITAYARDDV
jgi:hypothetical protein